MPLSTTVAKNLKATRLARKFSQEVLARKAGICVSYVSMLEREERTPPLDTLGTLAKALRVPVLSLLS